MNRQLQHCQSERVWLNLGGNADHTVEVNPYTPPKGFPQGSKVTVFVEADTYTGGVPAKPAAGPAVLNSQGDSVALPVKTNQAIFVHYDKGESNTVAITVVVTQN